MYSRHNPNFRNIQWCCHSLVRLCGKEAICLANFLCDPILHIGLLETNHMSLYLFSCTALTPISISITVWRGTYIKLDKGERLKIETKSLAQQKRSSDKVGDKIRDKFLFYLLISLRYVLSL